MRKRGVVENFTAEEVYENPGKIAWRIAHIIKNEDKLNRKIKDWDKKHLNLSQKKGKMKQKKKLERLT